ncbi:hypothetical protein [Geodermatophilus tzadiensis]|nr:hypothetical protein [Geodermatophilus tzadiensis]
MDGRAGIRDLLGTRRARTAPGRAGSLPGARPAPGDDRVGGAGAA